MNGWCSNDTAMNQGLVKQDDPGVPLTGMGKEFSYGTVEMHAKHTEIMFSNNGLETSMFLFHCASFAMNDIQERSLKVTFA